MRIFAAFVSLLVLTAGLCLAEQWTGWIADEKCATSGKYVGAEHKKCVESGQAIVFVNESDKKVYKLSDQEKVKLHVGAKVTLTGAMKGDTIEVAEVAGQTQ